VALDSARLEAQPTVHGEGSPGARAVAKHLGLEGDLRVEEVVVRPGEALQADGFLFDPMQLAGGPFRAAQGPAELMDATIHLTGGLSLRPALLPWALGTAAALLGTSAAAATVAKLYQGAVVAPAPAAEIGPAKVKRSRWP
jgi:hypothetical protein